MANRVDGKRKKKNDLLEAAYQLFTEKGVDSTTISDIAKGAGLGKGTFYLYFRDKQDIRQALILKKSNEFFQKIHKKNYAIHQDTVEDEVLNMVDLMVDELARAPKLLRFIAKNLGWGLIHKALLQDDNPEEETNEFYQWYTDLIQRSNRKFRNEELLVYMIFEFVGATSYDVILNNDPVPLDELKEEFAYIIPQMIQSQEIK